MLTYDVFQQVSLADGRSGAVRHQSGVAEVHVEVVVRWLVVHEHAQLAGLDAVALLDHLTRHPRHDQMLQAPQGSGCQSSSWMHLNHVTV